MSSTYETKVNVTTQINGVNASISSLQTRMNSAEQKITDSAIVSTVTSSSSWQTQTNNVNSALNKLSLNEQTKVNGLELLPQGYLTNDSKGYAVNYNVTKWQNNRMEVTGREWIKTDYIKFDRTKPLYWYINLNCSSNNLFYFGIERFDKNKNVINDAQNYATHYVVQGTNINGEREGYWQEADKSTAYIRLRILCDWNNTGTATTIINSVRWKQLGASVTDDLVNRMTSAESKITDTAITNTVKQNFYTKSETEAQITSKGYATSSELQQTSTSLIAKFSASGGYNLIRNSGFLKDFNFWGTHMANNPSGGLIGSINSTADWGFPNARINTAVIRLSNQSNVEYGLKCAVDTTIGKVYTIRFRYAAHRVSQVNVIVRNSSDGWHTNKAFNPSSYAGGKGSADAWGTFTHTFIANSTSHVLNFAINTAANDGYFWIAEPMVFEGTLDAPYSPHPSEVYWGQILLDQNGIRVNASNVNTYTEMNASGFFVKNNSGLNLFEASNKVALYNGNGVSCVEIVNDPNANYGNARIDVRGGINFIHNPGQDVGLNQILLGNDDRSDAYGYHNMSIRCWNSFGFQDNYGYTNMFADVRRGRWIMKGALYQNTATPPSTFSMNFEGEDEIYNSGYSRELAVESIMNLKTGVYVDNDGECCSAIYGGYSELITTEYKDEYGDVTTHLNHEALNASLVVMCQEQQKLIDALRKELNEIKECLNVV